MEHLRTCTTCNEPKSLDAYYKHPFAKNGRQTKCIECTKAAVRKNRAANIEYYRAYDRVRDKFPHREKARKEASKADTRSWPEKDPQKRAARVLVGNALRNGGLLKPSTCEVCALPCDPHGHHEDYSKPLELIWCCTGCHALIHAYWRVKARKAAK